MGDEMSSKVREESQGVGRERDMREELVNEGLLVNGCWSGG